MSGVKLCQVPGAGCGRSSWSRYASAGQSAGGGQGGNEQRANGTRKSPLKMTLVVTSKLLKLLYHIHVP